MGFFDSIENKGRLIKAETKIFSLENEIKANKAKLDFFTTYFNKLDAMKLMDVVISYHRQEDKNNITFLEKPYNVIIAECDVCGCLLDRKTAIRGRSRIEQKKGDIERVKEVYYCKVHCPTDEQPNQEEPVSEPKVEIDDTTAFGMANHNHSKHRVYVAGLTYEEALDIKSNLEHLLKKGDRK